MKTLIPLLIVVALSAPAQAGWYFELAVGVHHNRAAQPEIDLPGPLGKIVFGVEAQNGWAVEFEHVSSIPEDESGLGLNTLWFVKRVYF